MDDGQVETAVRVACALEDLGAFRSDDWVRLGTTLVGLGSDDEGAVDLAILHESASGWETAPVTRELRDRLDIPVTTANDATELVARLLADDLRARPAAVSAPMIRMLARLAPPDYASDLANECSGTEEYLDCDCARVDPAFEAELEGRAPHDLPDVVVRVLACRLRASLPTVQPVRNH
ncbi:hypothetical protein [Flexivirga sp. B27]